VCIKTQFLFWRDRRVKKKNEKKREAAQAIK
jgi:hypothetical protein